MNNKDMFDNPEIKETMRQMEEGAMQNLSEREKGFIKKNDIMINYINKSYLNRLYATHDESFIELNVYLINIEKLAWIL